jgi:ATP-dependent helicase/DNAse subunit B
MFAELGIFFVNSVCACKIQEIKLNKLANYFSQGKSKERAASDCPLGANMLTSNTQLCCYLGCPFAFYLLGI